MYTKLRYLSCFNNGLLTNQVTNILTEVVPFCKSDHIYVDISPMVAIFQLTICQYSLCSYKEVEGFISVNKHKE